MTEADLDQIETQLSITLPSDYREIVLHFPVRFEEGTTNGDLWDDAAALIERNQQLRTVREDGGVELKPLPQRYFLFGEDGAGWQHLIDTSSEPSMIYTMEYESVDKIRPTLSRQKQHQTLNQWLDAYLEEYRQEGIDITAESFHQDETIVSQYLILGACLAFPVVIVLIKYGFDMLFSQ